MESLGVKKYWASKENPKELYLSQSGIKQRLTITNLRKTAKAKYPNSKYPNYELMRDMGTWLEEDNIYRPQERPIKKEDDKYIVHGHEYPI